MKDSDVKERLESLYDDLNVAVIVIGHVDGRILYMNRRVVIDMEKTVEEIVGTSYRDFFWPDFLKIYEKLARECADGQVHTGIYHWIEKSMWEQVSCQLVPWTQGGKAYLLTITNITEVSRSEYEYRHLALFDQQLGLPNGRKLEADIGEIEAFDRVALIHFGIDNYTSINDLYGWDAGDYLLLQVRDWLISTLLKTSMLYRVRENEFCLLIRDISMERVKRRAKEILDRFSKVWALPAGKDSLPLYCTVTMGVVYGKYVQGDMRNLLYRTINAPEQTEDGYVLYDEEMDRQIRDRMLLRQNLINCIQQDMRGFSVDYQPIVDAKTEKWVGAEALCRWRTPDGKNVPPDVFIPEVEHMGQIMRLDGWVRKTALTQCAAWGLADKHFWLDVNLSSLQRVNEEFVSKLVAVIEEANYPKNKLSLEITESSQVDFSQTSLSGLEKLCEEGIVLALDDFGTGYASFDNLVNIPAKAIKTERSFVKNLEQNSYLQYLLQVMVDIAHKVDMKLIAEGVETQAQKTLLQSFGVDNMQGYLFSKPLPAEEFEKQLWRFER